MRHCGLFMAGYLMQRAMHRTPLVSSVLYCHRARLLAERDRLRSAIVRAPTVASNHYHLANILLERGEYTPAGVAYLNALVVCARVLCSEATARWRLWSLRRNREDDWATSSNFFE